MDVIPGKAPVYAHYNVAALEKTGRSLSDIVGKTSIDVFGSEFGTAACEEQQKTITLGKQRKYEYELPLKDEIRIVRTTLTPQFDAKGRVIRLIGNPIDVSIEWVAQNAKTKLETISTEVEQFIAMAAHDLRTPMRNVLSLAELLEEGFENHGDGKIELIELLKDTSEKSMSLISDVLSYASTLNLSSTTTLYPFETMCQNLMHVLDPQGLHRIECTSITLSGEKSVMQIVLHNLIDNALKHGNTANLTVRCHARMLGTSEVEVTVSDDGAGFDNPGKLFLETGQFLVDSGYGLLAIRKLILARGGKITAFNHAETGGSAVQFTLPSQTVTLSEGSERFSRSEPSAMTEHHKGHPRTSV
ncbi:PAS domain-containing sensor histidine kinase [uncultured Sulfitobacter sp.]|uniref:PAS domain-containing sensor histidine kinase n=1 Tax=uncultured Sulfitobacter sp. TaxID=191468 RepID=UPI002616A247|nr:PAS domain-containing sensor histidine kinase [uncultured Sulfitobacter sp.]